MLDFQSMGIPTVDYGNNIRQVAFDQGVAKAFDFPALELYPSPRLLGVLPAAGFYFAYVDGPVSTKDVRFTAADGEGRPDVILEDADAVDTAGFGGDATIVTR